MLHVNIHSKSMAARAAEFLNGEPHGKKSTCVWTAKNNILVAMVQCDLLDTKINAYLVNLM